MDTFDGIRLCTPAVYDKKFRKNWGHFSLDRNGNVPLHSQPGFDGNPPSRLWLNLLFGLAVYSLLLPWMTPPLT